MAETRWGDRQLRIWEAAVEAEPGTGSPGEVLRAEGGTILVATGAGTLRLLRLQLAGRRAMSAAEFLNAQSLHGVRFG